MGVFDKFIRRRKDRRCAVRHVFLPEQTRAVGWNGWGPVLPFVLPIALSIAMTVTVYRSFDLSEEISQNRLDQACIPWDTTTQTVARNDLVVANLVCENDNFRDPDQWLH